MGDVVLENIMKSMGLWVHKGGKQMFSFRDKGEREIALIPELTPTVSRMVAARKDLVKPLKWLI